MKTDQCGMCVNCHEWATVGQSCCGGGVYFEGSFVLDEDFESELEVENQEIVDDITKKE